MAELSHAGERYGRAFCLSPDRENLTMDELTESERSCVTTTGLSWQERIQAKFGVGVEPLSSFHSEVQRHIESEARDAQEYRELAEIAPNPQAKQTLEQIAADQERHKSLLMGIY